MFLSGRVHYYSAEVHSLLCSQRGCVQHLLGRKAKFLSTSVVKGLWGTEIDSASELIGLFRYLAP